MSKRTSGSAAAAAAGQLESYGTRLWDRADLPLAGPQQLRVSVLPVGAPDSVELLELLDLQALGVSAAAVAAGDVLVAAAHCSEFDLDRQIGLWLVQRTQAPLGSAASADMCAVLRTELVSVAYRSRRFGVATAMAQALREAVPGLLCPAPAQMSASGQQLAAALVLEHPVHAARLADDGALHLAEDLPDPAALFAVPVLSAAAVRAAKRRK